MCIIIDANRISDILSKSVDAKPIIEWIAGKNGQLAAGGHLMSEYKYSNEFLRFVQELERSGKLKKYDDNAIENEKKKMLSSGHKIKSDDHHVLSLAIVSQCRLIYTHDANLIQDFKNIKLITPKGKIYRTHKNKALLAKSTKCR